MSRSAVRIEQLRERLRQLDAARGVMVDDALDALRQETADELRNLEAGTAEAAGEPVLVPSTVTASGRSVAIAGDAGRTIIITGDGNRVSVNEARPELLFDAYLASLAGDCGQLPLGIIDTQFVRDGRDRGEPGVRLSEVYVDLDVTSPARPEKEGEQRAWAWRLVRGEAAGRTPLIQALAAGSGSRLPLGRQPAEYCSLPRPAAQAARRGSLPSLWEPNLET